MVKIKLQFLDTEVQSLKKRFETIQKWMEVYFITYRKKNLPVFLDSVSEHASAMKDKHKLLKINT